LSKKKIQANRTTLPTKQKVIKPTNQIRLIPIKFQKNSLLVSLIYFLATLQLVFSSFQKLSPTPISSAVSWSSSLISYLQVFSSRGQSRACCKTSIFMALTILCA
jgi:hypothetical protein